ncbi:MAG: hypothetical protein A4E71_00595 [Smithella sp. PtaU1.Bin162]|nr:MAG: hypothetical protein A4E71_00595 [Smithella sp. PtaU1.Bin162]
MRKNILILLSVILIMGCTATLPQKMEISKNYSLLGAKSYSLKIDNSKANIDPNLNKNFLSGYTQLLESNVKMALLKIAPELNYINDNSDISIEINIEEIHGGSAAARFWVGFGAGRSVSTVFVKVFKKGEIQAEARITETTTLTNLATGNYSNEDALMQDVPLISRNIAEFISNPSEYKEKNNPNKAN